MKKLLIIYSLTIFTIQFAVGQNVIKIGSQVWMTENLDVDKFRNGDIIPEVKSADEWIEFGNLEKPAWCYYESNDSNIKKYGKLYNWYAVNDNRGLAPVGFHIPNDSEWIVLINNLGGEKVAGSKLKNSSGWINYDGFNSCNSCKNWTNEYRAIHKCNVCKNSKKVKGIKSGNGNNISGFAALPGGCRNFYQFNVVFNYLNESGSWWSLTQNNSQDAGSINLSYLDNNVEVLNSSKAIGLSVRCIKN